MIEPSSDSVDVSLIQWDVGLKVADHRRYDCSKYRGRTVIRYLDGNQEFTIQERTEQEAYMEHPSAFWNRPDGDYLSDEPYVPVGRAYEARRDQTMEYAL